MPNATDLLPPLPRAGEDPVIEVYKRDVDKTLIIELGRLTPDQRVRRLQAVVADLAELRRAGKKVFG